MQWDKVFIVFPLFAEDVCKSKIIFFDIGNGVKRLPVKQRTNKIKNFEKTEAFYHFFYL
jgi:hypothetical protein